MTHGMSACPRCHSEVTLHEGRPFVTGAGAIELWHRACWDERDRPRVAPADVEPPPVAAALPRLPGRRARTIERLARLRIERVGIGLACAAALGVGFAQLRRGDASPVREHAHVELATPETPATRELLARSETAPPAPTETAEEARWPVPVRGGVRLDATFTSLADWIHPVTGSPEHMPPLVTRHFGAVRAGVERAECGAGHCGVDLDGPRGRPLVAVADGVVVRVERSERGSDGRSGRYVRLLHDDGTLTAYMHMDDVADVDVGDRVRGGQYIGTLGATAVFSAPPHLHFSLEVPNRPGVGKQDDTHYVDPAPFLVRARIVATPERRHAIKPAF